MCVTEFGKYSRCYVAIDEPMTQINVTNNGIIFKYYIEMKLIQRSYLTTGDHYDSFLYEASNILCVKCHKFIKKCYIHTSLVFHKVLEDKTIIVSISKN